MKSIVYGFVWLMVLSVGGCAGNPGESVPASLKRAYRLEQRADSKAGSRSYAEAVSVEERALRLYALQDDRAGQLRSHLSLVRLHLLLESSEQAQRHLDQSAAIATELGERHYLYQYHLLSGKLKGNRDEYETALGYADSPAERAVVLTYLEQYGGAYEIIDEKAPASGSEADDFGFVLYQYARHARDAGVAEQALVIFKKTDNAVGISDTLYLLARIAAEKGNREHQEEYLRRALAVNIALDDEKRIRVINSELERFRSQTSVP